MHLQSTKSTMQKYNVKIHGIIFFTKDAN